MKTKAKQKPKNYNGIVEYICLWKEESPVNKEFREMYERLERYYKKRKLTKKSAN